MQAFNAVVGFLERHSPIPGDRHAPGVLPVSDEPMYSPTTGRVVDEVVHVGGQKHDRQDSAHPADQVRWQEPGCVVLEQTAQSSMTDRTNDQNECVR